MSNQVSVPKRDGDCLGSRTLIGRLDGVAMGPVWALWREGKEVVAGGCSVYGGEMARDAVDAVERWQRMQWICKKQQQRTSQSTSRYASVKAP